MEQYVILAIVLLVFFGLWFYLWNLDSRVTRLMKELEEERQDTEKRSNVADEL